MEQILLNLRVRPVRLAILIDKDAEASEFIRTVRFLSQVWGGRYSPIIPVDPEQPDELTAFRLGNLRPDFVYGVGVSQKQWDSYVHKACQPRQYSSLAPSVAEDVRNDQFKSFIHVDWALNAMLDARNTRSLHNHPLKVVSVDLTAELAPFCAAVFGVHHPSLRDEYRDESITFESDDVADFITLVKEFVEDWKQCWLDITGYRLEPHHMMTSPVEPTIVLVKDLTCDLTQFWNLRLASGTFYPQWIIPLPYEKANDPPVLTAVKEWLTAFLKYGEEPDYCIVTSTCVSEDECTKFAGLLRDELIETQFKAVDYEPPKNRLPSVLPLDHRTVWPAQLDGQRLTFTHPVPKNFQGLGSSESWFVDILSEARSGRAVNEAQLPESVVIPDLLNGPCPPHFLQSRINQFGDGIDSINAMCTTIKKVANLYIPSPEEIFEELLREHGYDIVPDEKRSSYQPTIRRFGSLHHAASAFSGQSGQVLEILRSGWLYDSQASAAEDITVTEPVPHPQTLRIDQIKSIGKFGRGYLSDIHYLDSIKHMFDSQSERTKRVGTKRFKDYANRHIPDEMTLKSLLEHWADKSVLRRRWEIGPCSTCSQASFVGRIDLHKPIRCPHCGSRVSMKERTRMGYTLRRSVRHSLNEGIVPVVLTGRFLKNLTDKGFLWLPGMKYSKNGTSGDIDIIACCDGHIVFAECKTKPQNPELWEKIADQFLENARVAITCEANIVILSAQVETFPTDVQQRIQAELDGKISYLLLNNEDLQSGNRKIQQENTTRHVRLGDLLLDRFPETPAPERVGSRQIKLRWGGVYTKQPRKQDESEDA